MGRTGEFQESVSPCRRSRACARRFKYQVDAAHQQLFLPDGNLELCRRLLSRAGYVDWFGLSVYGQQFKDEPWANIRSLVDWPYQEMSQLDPNKPIMIAEWATGEFPHAGNKGEWIKDGLDNFRTRYPRIKAAVYWHERWQNEDQSYSNLHINSSVDSLNAYREGIANPYWLGNLILRVIKQSHPERSEGPRK